MKSRKAHVSLSLEADETLNAIRAGQIDAIVIERADSRKLYALRSFEELNRTQAKLRSAGIERKRTKAQLQALVDERERLFQDLHDGCIQSIYAIGLTMESAIGAIPTQPQRAEAMLGESIASLNLVIQELRAFMTGEHSRLGAGRDLRSEVEQAVRASSNRGLEFAVDIDAVAMRSLTGEQSLQLVQIARECISNVARHSKARSGHISLHQRNGRLRFEVRDDGCGFVHGQSKEIGFGLHHIRVRARKMGATTRVISTPGKGARIAVLIDQGPPPRRTRPRT